MTQLYRVIPAMTQDFGLQGLIRRTTQLRHLLRQAIGTEDHINFVSIFSLFRNDLPLEKGKCV